MYNRLPKAFQKIKTRYSILQNRRIQTADAETRTEKPTVEVLAQRSGFNSKHPTTPYLRK